MPSSFTEYPLSEEILSALEQLQYRTPTPVQVKVIPEILKGKDVLAKSSEQEAEKQLLLEYRYANW